MTVGTLKGLELIFLDGGFFINQWLGSHIKLSFDMQGQMLVGLNEFKVVFLLFFNIFGNCFIGVESWFFISVIYFLFIIRILIIAIHFADFVCYV
jgi:hypothetical protein